MTGPEHFAEAERLMSPDVIEQAGYDSIDAVLAHIAGAQVHATLALAAAQAEAHPRSEWREAIA